MRFVFDSIIFFTLIFSGYWLYWISRSFFYTSPPELMPKTKIVRLALSGILAIIFLIIGWGSFIEPQLIKIKPVSINLNTTKQKENLKVILVSDFHAGTYKKSFYVQRVVNKIKKEQPDLLLMAGDFILGKERNANYLFPLAKLSALIPTFAVTGNHEFNLAKMLDSKYQDKTTLLRALFKKWDIKILDNATQLITVKDSRLNIAGVSDLWTDKANLEIINKFIDHRYPKIILSHNPDVILDKASENFDLVLTGHTHCGQIRLPLLGSVPAIPNKLGRAFDCGLFKLKKGFLYVTGGLAESGPRARLFNRPEITVINLDL